MYLERVDPHTIITSANWASAYSWGSIVNYMTEHLSRVIFIVILYIPVQHSYRLEGRLNLSAVGVGLLQRPTRLLHSTVQCIAVHYSAVQYSAVQCSAVQCSLVQCWRVQCSRVLLYHSFSTHTAKNTQRLDISDTAIQYIVYTTLYRIYSI